MFKKIAAFLLCFVFLFTVNVYAKSENISARYAVAIDKVTGTVLYDNNMNDRASMASTTKIMTCLIACEKLNFDDTVTITRDMLNKAEGSLIYLKAGDNITVGDLIKGALLASGNDAANALAVAVSGSIGDFVSLMNEYAEEFNLKNTHFETPSGLDSGEHYSTAYDMAILTSHALDNELFSSVCSMQSAEIIINSQPQTIYNHNKLLYKTEDCIGVKTGYTEKSGRCLVSAFNYKKSTIIIVTLNAYDDWNDHQKILDFSKKRYRVYSKAVEIPIDVVGGVSDSLLCRAEYDIAYINSIETEACFYPIIYAPVIQGSKVGKLKIYSNNKLIGTVDIIAPESVTVWQTTK